MRVAMLIGLSLLAVIMPAASWSGENLSGRASVVDGDTLSLRGKVVGLNGVAAPSLKQDCLDASGRSYSCGAASARALAAQVGTAIITCETRQPDQNGRILATCRNDGEDLSAWIVAQGHATADRRVSTAYVVDERRAWATRRGLWAGVFDDPAPRRHAPFPTTHLFVAAQSDERANEPFTTSSVKR